MESKTSYPIMLDSALIQKLLFEKYFAKVVQTVSNIKNENLSLPIEYQDALNCVAVAHVVNLTDSTMKKVAHVDSSISRSNTDRVKFKITEEPNCSTEASKKINGILFQKKLIAIMQNENYTSGEICASESFVEATIQEVGTDCTMKWLTQIYESNYHRSNILIGILHMLSHFSYSMVKPYGPIMALALLQHKSNAVREFAIKAFENWNSKDSLEFLKNIRCDQPWLQEYLNEVIYDIEND